MKRSEQWAGGRGDVKGKRAWLLAWMLAAVTTLAACPPRTGTTTPNSCVPGRAESCDCVGGGRGVQVCAADGRSFGACQCGTTGPMGTCGTGGGACCNGGLCNPGLTCRIESSTSVRCRATACGAPGLPCCFDATGPRCANSECQVTESSSVCMSTVPPPTCPGGTVNCFGACTDISSDPGNCGACGNACGAGQFCGGNVCQNTSMPTIMVGGACTGLGTCPSSLTCITADQGFPGGYCTGRCTEHEQCGADGLCVPIDEMGNSICFVQCVPGSSCPRANYACNSVTPDNTVGVCLPSCNAPGVDGCNAEGTCNPSTGVCERADAGSP